MTAKWRIHWYDCVASTNDTARNLPPWNAVRADSQSSGRGRHGRTWVSDHGGLWLSMTIPIEGGMRRWRALPLAAGWAVLNVVRGLGIREARLRWPNDIIVNGKKLAGLLVEQFREGVAVVGVGVNVFNNPGLIQRDLTQKITRLADHLNQPPGLNELMVLILRHIADVHQRRGEGGFPAIAHELNSSWGTPRQVELTLDDEVRHGLFLGVNGRGDLVVKNDSGGIRAYPPLQVKLFREAGGG